MSKGHWLRAIIAGAFLAAALGSIAAATTSCVVTKQQRPASTLPELPKPDPAHGIEPVFKADFTAEEHHQPHVVPTHWPELTPALNVPGTVRIQVRHQDQETMSHNLTQDIHAAGGRVTRYEHSNGEALTTLWAMVPGQYLDRAEPLMRRTDAHINPHYTDWAHRITTKPAVRYDVRDQPTTMRFKIKGKYFNSEQHERLVGWSMAIGILATIISALALVRIIATRTKDR